MMLATLTRPQWLRGALRRLRLALLRTHYAQIKLACQRAVVDPAPESGQRLCDLVDRGLQVQARIAALEADR